MINSFHLTLKNSSKRLPMSKEIEYYFCGCIHLSYSNICFLNTMTHSSYPSSRLRWANYSKEVTSLNYSDLIARRRGFRACWMTVSRCGILPRSLHETVQGKCLGRNLSRENSGGSN